MHKVQYTGGCARLSTNMTPFYIRGLSIHRFWYPGVLAPIPRVYQGVAVLSPIPGSHLHVGFKVSGLQHFRSTSRHLEGTGKESEQTGEDETALAESQR